MCGSERPDEHIGVVKRPSRIQMPRGWPGNAMGPLTHHVRYCTDNPRCTAIAHEPGPWPGWGGREDGPHPLKTG